jgi:hypothetical protein
MLNNTPINIPKLILVVANTHTPPNSDSAAHTANTKKNA